MEKRDRSVRFTDGIRLEHVSKFKYLGCVLDIAGTDGLTKKTGFRSRLIRYVKDGEE